MSSNIPAREKVWQLIRKENTYLAVFLQFLERKRDEVLINAANWNVNCELLCKDILTMPVSLSHATLKQHSFEVTDLLNNQRCIGKEILALYFKILSTKRVH